MKRNERAVVFLVFLVAFSALAQHHLLCHRHQHNPIVTSRSCDVCCAGSETPDEYVIVSGHADCWDIAGAYRCCCVCVCVCVPDAAETSRVRFAFLMRVDPRVPDARMRRLCC